MKWAAGENLAAHFFIAGRLGLIGSLNAVQM